jgi:hypothetical protein
MSYIHRLDRILRNPGNVIEGRETAYAIAFLADAVSDLNETLRRGTTLKLVGGRPEIVDGKVVPILTDTVDGVYKKSRS